MSQQDGTDPTALRDVAGLIEARGAVAQVCVIKDGRMILDRSFGCGPDALFLLGTGGAPNRCTQP